MKGRSNGLGERSWAEPTKLLGISHRLACSRWCPRPEQPWALAGKMKVELELAVRSLAPRQSHGCLPSKRHSEPSRRSLLVISGRLCHCSVRCPCGRWRTAWGHRHTRLHFTGTAPHPAHGSSGLQTAQPRSERSPCWAWESRPRRGLGRCGQRGGPSGGSRDGPGVPPRNQTQKPGLPLRCQASKTLCLKCIYNSFAV